MNKPIVLTAVITAILTAILTTAGVLGAALYFRSHQVEAQTENPPAQAASSSQAEEQAPEQAKPTAKQPAPAETNKPTEADDPAQIVKLPISHDAFNKLIFNKTDVQVTRIIGPPTFTIRDRNPQALPVGTKFVWSYDNAIVDPLGNTYRVWLHFTNGVVDLIEDASGPTGQPEVAKPAESADQARTVKLPISRDAFDKLVINKTKEQVVRMIGKPYGVGKPYPNQEYWYWLYSTVDPATGKTDYSVEVIFIGDIATDVNHIYP